MQYSLKWLNQFVAIDDALQKPDELIDLLNMKGLEVVGTQQQGWPRISVGQIIQIEAHPNADRLQLCMLRIKEGEAQYSIVCGATNLKKGDKVAVCLEGSCLPSGLSIKDKKVRGEMSQGMLASLQELDMSFQPEKMQARSLDEGGIIILSEQAPVGLDLDEYLEVKDICLDIELPPNRADLLSYIGLAREIGGLMDRPLRLDNMLSDKHYKSGLASLGIFKNRLESRKLKLFTLDWSEDLPSIKIKVEEKDICPYYQAFFMKGIKVGPSPYWLKNKLQMLGKKSINNVVDITNWILLEWGQPMHAFDLSQLKSGIQVKKAKEKDKLLALDGREIELRGDELVIYDNKKPLALAGVIGGQDSGISETTTDILLEGAQFASYAIRRTNRRYGFNTDSAFMFSRGVSPQTIELALMRACYLIQQVAGGQVLRTSYKVGSAPIQKKSISITKENLFERLDYPISMPAFSKVMKNLNCEVQKKGLKIYKVTPPHYRKDLNIKEDLIEEWARIKGYEYVGENVPTLLVQDIKQTSRITFLNKIKHLSKESQLHQAINYSLIDNQFQKSFLNNQNLFPDEQTVILSNPMSSELDSLRQSLLPGLFKNLLSNIRYGRDFGRMFEQGTGFRKLKQDGDCTYEETDLLSFMYWGNNEDIWTHKKQSTPLFYQLKAGIDNILSSLGISHLKWKQREDETLSFLHPNQQVFLSFQDKYVGYIGSLHPSLLDQNKIRTEVALGEINLSYLLTLPRKDQKFKSISNLPSVKRDINIVIPKNQEVYPILSQLRKKKFNSCKEVEVIDLFEGDKVGKDLKSITFRFTFQSLKKTLSDTELNKLQEEILDFLQKSFNLNLRG